MTIRYLRYLALLGCTSSLLNWNVAYGMDEEEDELSWSRSASVAETEQASDVYEKIKALEIDVAQMKKCQAATTQLLSDISNMWQIFQVKLIELQQLSNASASISPQIGGVFPPPPPPLPVSKGQPKAAGSNSVSSPLIPLKPSKTKPGFTPPTTEQLKGLTLRGKEAQKPLAEKSPDKNSLLLAELKKKIPKLSEEDTTLLGDIHKAIADGEFKSRFVVLNKPKVKVQQESFVGILESRMGDYRKAHEEPDDDSDSIWGDEEVCDSTGQTVNAQQEEILPPELEKLERITDVSREAIVGHNDNPVNTLNQIVPMPPRASNKNEMLLWEWKYYSSPGQKKRLNEIVRAYIIREQLSLNLKYGNLNPDKATLNHQTSRMVVNAPDSDMAMSVCSSSSTH